MDIKVESDSNTAMLVSASETLPEFTHLTDESHIAHLITHSTGEANNSERCNTVLEFTNSTIEECSIWQHLTIMEQSLNESNENMEKEHHNIIDALQEHYERSPDSFTQNLLTIIEESIMNDSGISNLLTSINNSETTSASSVLSSNDSSTLSGHFKNFFKKQSLRYPKTPFAVANVERSCETNSDCESNYPETPCTVEDTHFNIPCIIVHSGTPRKRKSLRLDEDDAEEYLTAESETDSSELNTAIIMDESESSLNNKIINMSNVRRRHDKWIKTYEEAAACESRDADFIKTIAKRQGKVAEYKSKLEKKMLGKLALMREECMNSLNILIENIARKSSKREDSPAEAPSAFICDCCRRKMQFCKTMVACSEYFTCAINSRDTLISKAHNRRRSNSKSPLSKKNNNNNNNMPNSATGRPRRLKRSLNKKIKSPGATLVVNPRRRSGAALSPETRKSSRRSLSKISQIDRSSIKPVSELRRLFSPRRNIPDSLIPLPTIIKGPKSYVSMATLKTTPRPSKPSLSPWTNKKFRHVKSPVKEYIKGNK